MPDDTTKALLETARRIGREAYEKDWDVTENPYKDDPDMKEAWRRGWFDHCDEPQPWRGG